MSQQDVTLIPVYKLTAEIAARRMSPVELVDAYLARIEAHEPKLHAFIEVYADDARLAAEAADEGDPRRPCGRTAARHPDRA